MKSTLRMFLFTFSISTLVAFGLRLTASAESIDDFKKAAAETEVCRTIPYSSTRDKCLSKRDDVRDYCKTEDSGCRDLNAFARLQDLEKARRDLEEFQRTRSNLSSQRDSASDDAAKDEIGEKIDASDKDIESKKHLIDELAKTAEDFRYQATGRLEKAKRCREARIDAVETFDEAIHRARSESEPEIQKVAATLISKWEEGDQGHTIAIKQVQERLLICEKASKGERFD